jgi:hypothetical protein
MPTGVGPGRTTVIPMHPLKRRAFRLELRGAQTQVRAMHVSCTPPGANYPPAVAQSARQPLPSPILATDAMKGLLPACLVGLLLRGCNAPLLAVPHPLLQDGKQSDPAISRPS